MNTSIHKVILCCFLMFFSFLPSSSSLASQHLGHKKTGTLKGVIRDIQTGEPVSGVFVDCDYVGSNSDANGSFLLSDQQAGLYKVTAFRRDYLSTQAWVRIRAGRIAILNLKMRRAAPALIKLAGEWSVTLVMDTPSASHAAHKQTSGTLLFSPDIPSPFLRRPAPVHPADSILDEYGRFAIDFRPLFGVQVQINGSTSIQGGKPGQSLLTEAQGRVYAGNKVEIDLIPRMSHGGVSFMGKIQGDKIVGTWWLRAFAGGDGGSFVMQRRKEHSTTLAIPSESHF